MGKITNNQVLLLILGGGAFSAIIVYLIIECPGLFGSVTPSIQQDTVASITQHALKADTVKTATTSSVNVSDLMEDETEEQSGYTFNGMVGKPWTYYKVISGKFYAIKPTDPQLGEIIDNWKGFIREIKDIQVQRSANEATLTVFTTKTDHYSLTRRSKDTYSLEGQGIAIILQLNNTTTCTVYFCRESLVASVTNKPFADPYYKQTNE